MFNINAKSLKRLAIILGAVIVIMGMIATIGAYAYSGNADGAAAVTAEASGDGYVANADAAADKPVCLLCCRFPGSHRHGRRSDRFITVSQQAVKMEAITDEEDFICSVNTDHDRRLLPMAEQ